MRLFRVFSRSCGSLVEERRRSIWHAKMQPKTQALVPRDVLRGVQNSITDMVKDVANEPSVGLYFVQQHVHKAVPGLLSLKGQLVEGTQEALLYTEDVRDALASVKTMKEIGPPVVNKMIASLNASLQLLPTLHHPMSQSRPPPATYSHLSRSATHHGSPAFLGLSSGTKPTTGIESNNHKVSEKVSTAAKESAGAVTPRSPRSASTQAHLQPPVSSQIDSSGYVSSLLSSAYQRASSMRISMPSSSEAKDGVPVPSVSSNGNNVPNITSEIPTSEASSAGSGLNKSYWTVFESAIQKAGHMVGAGSMSGSGNNPNSAQGPILVRSHSATNLRESPNRAQLQEVLESAVPTAGSAAGGSKEGHEGHERSLLNSTDSPAKLADWLKLPSTALRKLSRRDGNETSQENGGQVNIQELLEREGLEEEDVGEGTGLDLEDPEVLESYAKLQAEQAAKLEAWLGNAEEDEVITPS